MFDTLAKRSVKVPAPTWLQVVKHAPLVSIDLLVCNTHDQVLLGWRNNKPAQHTWFVPGGVVRKHETLQQAFERTVYDELGISLHLERAGVFTGVYEHHYPDNFADESGVGTHYVVLAHRLNLSELNMKLNEQELPKAQHHRYVWMSKAELLTHPDVHEHTKAYFQDRNG